MRTFPLTVSSPDGNIFSGEAVSIILRGAAGDLMVMAGHIPFVTAVKEAPCTVWLPDGTKKEAHSDGGLLTVGPEGATYISGSFKFSK